MSDVRINDFKFEDFLNSVEIVKIYKGKDEYCRCGCGGKYRYSKFNRLVKNAISAFHELRSYGDEQHKFRFMFRNASNFSEGYINIPIYNERNPKYNQCYCIYFKNKIS